ncbi:pancreatic secretory granule membrane major glycoprotein GP2-like [Anneissia japonica]|uniref:pancreatic secretory granule membrane major glycoprotein GP2-like n=1 Tax=Anneissia japonica TaxID=1529436 RepID=UPI0014257DB5|nr:pancreatic secretory granule membrane major glycoprotein GP2-like [Anneissia japonica]
MKEDFHFTVECLVNNRGPSLVEFATMADGEIVFERKSGNFTFTMALYTNGSYSIPYSGRQYPVKLSLGSKVFVGASVQTFSNDMVLIVDSCKTTLNPDLHVNPQHKLIENSCAVDSTVNFDGQSTINNTSRVFFSFDIFGFSGDYSTVFVQCQLSVCNESDVQCRRDCQQPELLDVTTPKEVPDTVNVTIGPVKLNTLDDDLDVSLDAKDSTSGRIFPALSTTLWLPVSLVVFSVACVIWIKSKTTNRKTNVEKNWMRLEKNP